VSRPDGDDHEPGSELPESPEPAGGSARPPGRPGSQERVEGRGGVPRWRQIEILKERRALRELLDDFEEDFDLDEEVFGFDEDDDTYFRSSDEGEEDTEADAEHVQIDEFYEE